MSRPGLFASVLIASQILVSSFASVAKAGAGEHLSANNCEIFVDKIVAFRGSHGLHALQIYVKTINERLDSPISKVGFHGREFSPGAVKISLPWNDIGLQHFMNSDDYFTILLTLASDFGRSDYEGAFFVRTANGTAYWIRPDVKFNLELYNLISQAYPMSFSGDPKNGMATQDSAIAWMNPNRCF